MEHTTKGAVLKGMVRMVEEKKDGEGMEKVRALFGDPLTFSSLKEYPTDITKRLNSAIAVTMFGQDNEQSQFEVGKMLVDMYFNTVIGKTVFSLMGKDLSTLAINASKIFSTFVTGLEVMSERVGENGVKITLKNDPFPVSYRKGMFTRAAEMFHKSAHIETKILGVDACEYDCMWQ